MKKTIFFCAFFALAFCAVLFAQEQSKLVTAIEIKGNKSISANKVMSQLKTQIGSTYQESIVSDDLKRLYLTGYFNEDIKVDTEEYKDGVKVVITVSERPVIEKISFTSGKKAILQNEPLKTAIKSKVLQYLSYPLLEDDTRSLKKYYEKKGYIKAQVGYNVDIDQQANKAKIEFNIETGVRQKIKKIYVEGNTNFSDRRILRLIKTKSSWFFNSGALKEDVLKEDLERIKTFYHKAGFIDADVAYESKTDPKGRFVYLSLKVTEGEKYLVGTLAIQGNKEIQEKEILAKIKECIPGKTFSHESLREDIISVQGLYFDRGYISANVQEITSLNVPTGRIDIVLEITENTVVYVDKIKIRGNVKTKDVVIRRELRLKPSERFDGVKLRRSKERLQNLGFFEEVSYDTEDTDSPDKKDLVIDVKESKTGMFSFGGGYSSVDKLVGFIEIEQKNFDLLNWPYFTGAGQDLKIRASFGSLTKGYDLSFTEPWIFGYPYSFGVDLYSRTHDRESDVGYGYDEKVTGGALRLGKEITEYLRTDLAFRYDNIDITNVNELASLTLLEEAGKNATSSMELALTYDSRDNVFNPVRGDLGNIGIQVAGGPFGADRDFWKFFSRGSHYFPLVAGSVLETRARVGIAEPYSDTERISIFERFFAGGASTIRGYRERKIGPIDALSGDPLGGNAFLVGNLEYTYPVLNFFRAAAFYDIGNVWSKAGDLGFSELKAGVGVGLRIKTPIGPILLDYGIPLDKEPGQETKGKGRFYFSMSRGF